MGFLSMFGGSSNQNQNQGQPQQPNGGQQPNPQGQQGQLQGQPNQGQQGPNPSSHSQVSNSDVMGNPADMYAKMWENNPNKTEAPRLKIDGKVLDEVSGKMDFMQGIPQELMQKATSGDVQSLIQMMGMVAQKAYRSSIEHGSVLTDTFVDQRDAFRDQSTGSAVREELLMQDLFKGADGKPLPTYAKKQIADIAKRLQQANPDASPQEIAESARNYVKEMAKMMSGESSSGSEEQSGMGGNKAASMDWDKWADQQ